MQQYEPNVWLALADIGREEGSLRLYYLVGSVLIVVAGS